MPVTYQIKDGIGFIRFNQEDSKVNLLTFEVIKRLNAILDEVSQNLDLRALILMSDKKDVFIAGADIKEIENITQESDGEEKSKVGQRFLNKLEDLPIPTIAVIEGVTLGGGCELALACRYRIATFNDKVKIGLPEVNLGIIPGFGGTYRFPRLVGLSQGLKMIVSGKPISSKEAFKIGFLDQICPSERLECFIREFIDTLIDQKASQPRKFNKNNFKGIMWFLEKTFIGQTMIFYQTRRLVNKNTKGFYPAPLKAIDVIQKTYFQRRGQALNTEAKAFSKLVVTDISRNLIKLFYLTETYKKLTLPATDHITLKPINKCGVIGAGTMGGSIAQILSYKNMWVRLKDINYAALGLGLRSAYKLYQKAVKSKRIKKAEARGKQAHITGTLNYSGFRTADVVIEAVVENMEVKKKVFKELSNVVAGDTILCTNTSALSVTEMARQTQDPSRVIGLHFFNPVHRMPLIEVIKTEETSQETIIRTLHFVKRLGKTPILVKDSCGFLVNRILLSYINEAGRILEEGGRISDIDRIMTNFGMPMGPFRLSDEVGLDVGVSVLHILEEGLGSRFKPIDIFDKVCQLALLGKKCERGFYVYKKQISENSKIYSLLRPNASGTIDEEECLKRMIYIMINEAARCLEEGVVDDPGAVDIGLVMGTGFPPFRGGLLRYADARGIGNVLVDFKHFEAKFKDNRFKPCAYLCGLADKSQNFYQT